MSFAPGTLELAPGTPPDADDPAVAPAADICASAWSIGGGFSSIGSSVGGGVGSDSSGGLSSCASRLPVSKSARSRQQALEIPDAVCSIINSSPCLPLPMANIRVRDNYATNQKVQSTEMLKVMPSRALLRQNLLPALA